MRQLLLVAGILMITLSSFAQQAEEEGHFELNARHETYWLPDEISSTIYTEFKDQVKQFEIENPSSDVRSLQCTQAYTKLFNKADIHWSIFFGYSDYEDSVYTTDYAEKDLFEKELTTDCPMNSDAIHLCGFQVEDLGAARYVKQIRTRENTLVNIHIQLYNSSYSSETKLNKTSLQKEKSKKIEAAFLNSLHTDDIVFFSGHARHGTGPGMRPLIEKSKDWWTSVLFRPWIRNIELSLDPRPSEISFTGQASNPSLIGFFMCDAEGHYGAELARHSPESSLILTRQTVEAEDGIRLLYAASNSLLKEDCEEDFQQHMNLAINTYYYRKKKGPPKNFDSIHPKIFNFFHKDKVNGRNDIVQYFRFKDEVELAKASADITKSVP